MGFTGNSWIIVSGIEASIKRKIEASGKPLKEWDIQINYGIKTGLNEAFIINEEKKNELLKKCPKAAEIIRPILLGKNVKRYRYSWENLWVINSHNGIKSHDLKRIDVENDYPSIYNYLKSFLPKIANRADQGETWANLRNCAYLNEFEKPKIVWGNLATTNQFAFVEEPMIINNPSNFIATDKLYLLAILNSKLADFYIKQLGVTRNGGYFEYKPMFVEQLPIASLSEKNKDELTELVNKIITRKGDANLAERMIENIVFKAYNISEDEQTYINSL